MKSILVNLTPTSGSGFANQMYIYANSVLHAATNGINIIFYTRFLKQIHTNEYCNIGDIIDIPKMNKYLQKYNVIMVDYYNYTFKIESIQYGTNAFKINASDTLNIENIDKTYNFKEITKLLSNAHYKKYSIPINTTQTQLFLTWTLDGILYSSSHKVINNFLEDDINYKFNTMNSLTFKPHFSNSPIFYDVKANIAFKSEFNEKIVPFMKDIVKDTNKINCIHLRLEDDAVQSWANETNTESKVFKKRIEDKYINEIINKIKKDDLTIILSHNYDNNVIRFLEKNKYNFIATPIWSDFRDISAIYDLHVGEYCNNIYICVFESSFSYLLLHRIKHKIKEWHSITYTV